MASITAVGLPTREATKLRKHGVRTTDALLKVAATKTGRRNLAGKTKLAERDVLGWVNRADLMRVKGIGPEYADLLEVAGVDTVKELRTRNAENLLDAMTDLNTRMRLVRRLPTTGMVMGWVGAARELEPVVKY
jgi:predicted flap endonuclease-1-like 5' DNA nuclease